MAVSTEDGQEESIAVSSTQVRCLFLHNINVYISNTIEVSYDSTIYFRAVCIFPRKLAPHRDFPKTVRLQYHDHEMYML